MVIADRRADEGIELCTTLNAQRQGCARFIELDIATCAPMKLREMSLTCKPATAAELHAWGSVAYLTEPDELMPKAREVAANIASKQKAVVGFAKAALNHLDVFEMHSNYRMEQGYTYQLNIMGDGEAARDAFVKGERIITR